MKYLRNRFFAGLLILLPAVVTGWIIFKIFVTVDNLIRPLRAQFPIIDFPGVGVAAVVLIILFTGVFAGNFLGRRVIAVGDQLMTGLPGVRKIYMAVKELSGVFLSERKMIFRRSVLVRYPHENAWVLGFVTEVGAPAFGEATGRPLLHVFIPTTPNPTSGFLLFVPADDVVEVPIDVEQAMKMVISGGTYVPQHLRPPVG